MRDQVNVVPLRAGLKKISREASRRPVENDGELSQRNGRRRIESSRRAAPQNHLFDRIGGLFAFPQWLQPNPFVCWSWRRRYRLSPALPPLRDLLHGCKRRRLLHLQHRGIFHLALRNRNGRKAQRGNLSRLWRRVLRCLPDGYHAQRNLAPRIEIEKPIYLVVHKSQRDFGWQRRRRGNRQQICQQSPVVPTEMAIRTRLILPGISPIRSAADYGGRSMSDRRVRRCCLHQVPAKIALS